MAVEGGPKIINDGLVLCLDAHDAKSYAGEPTTNLSPNSDYSGASLNTINSGSNGGWGTTFDRWISEIEGPGERTVKAFHLKLTGSTGSAPNAEGDASLVSGIASQVASLTSGNSYRVSAWAKVIRANGSSTAQTSSNLLYLTGAAAIGSSSLTVNTTWTRISASFSISTTGSYRLYHYFYGVSVGDILVITEPQIELKSYNTPYVYSSRSATNGWVDRTTNNNDGTLVNGVNTGVSHYRDGQVIMPVANSYLDFDGSNDYITLPNDIGYTDAVSVFAWFKRDTNTGILGGYHIICGTHYLELSVNQGGNYLRNGIVVNGTRYVSNDGSAIGTNTWHYVGFTWSTSDYYKRSYVDGVNVGTQSTGSTGTSDYSFSGRSLGMWGGSSYALNGKIAAYQVYNRALTQAEVLSNYNATKERF